MRTSVDRTGSDDRILVTGSAGHLGEALMRTLRERGIDAFGIDVWPSPWTDAVGSIVERAFVADAMRGRTAVLHAATLHKPQVATRTRQDFVDVNVTGTSNLLEEAIAANVRSFVYTSTTSAFGEASTPASEAHATWITEEVAAVPKNIYGVTKIAAEKLCASMHKLHGLRCVVLRTSRFFAEDDDLPVRRDASVDANLKVNELLHRRVDIADVVDAHLLALTRKDASSVGPYIVSATTPFARGDLAMLATRAPDVVARLFPGYEAIYRELRWKMLPSIDRVYVNDAARRSLDWRPRFDFASALDAVSRGEDYRSALAQVVGKKDYHRTR